MEEIQPQSDNYRSSSSSASSPVNKIPPGNFFYSRKPGTLRKPISFADSPDWEESNIDVRVEPEPGDGITRASTASKAASTPIPKFTSESLLSPVLVQSAVRSPGIAGVSIAWKDLSITMKGKRKYSDQVIKGSTGYALPGTITVLMGPAKSGKSTLLRSIAGRLHSSAKMNGELFFNGVKMPLPYGSYGYVGRESTLIGSLTVREFLYYSALLQIPGSFLTSVDDAIVTMSLNESANKLIGGHFHKKGLPRGEKRRVAIARELVMNPHILFIDEPLYHLDSVSALLMMVTLKKLASTGCTLIFTIYQSSTEVFGLFDRICLLSNGNTLFFGETLSCLQHFSNAGFPCPIMQSPSDHFLRAINTDFDRIIAMCKNRQDDEANYSTGNMDTAVAIQTLEATYKSSSDATSVDAMVSRLTEKEGTIVKSRGKTTSVCRIAVLTRRSVVVMSREWKYFWLRFVLCTFLTLCIGSAFSGLTHTLSSIRSRVGALFSFISFTLLLTVSGVPSHMKEIQVYVSEESNGHSGTLVFLIAHFVAGAPFLFLIAVSSSLVFFFVVAMRNEFALFVYFVLNLFTCLLASEGLLLVISYLFREAFWSILTLLFLHVLMMVSCGYVRDVDSDERAVWVYPFSYIAFHSYSMKGLVKNEFLGTSFVVGVRNVSGVEALIGEYKISLHGASKWDDFLVLALMALAYRFLAFLFLRFAQRSLLFRQTPIQTTY